MNARIECKLSKIMVKMASTLADDTSSEGQSDNGVQEPNDPHCKILWAAEHNRIDLIKQLIELDPSSVCCVDSDGYTPLHRAAYNNHIDAVNMLIANGSDVSKCTQEGWQPLHCACHWNNANVAAVLLQNGADINAKTNGGQTPLHLAASLPYARETLLLLLTSPNIDTSVRNNCNETPYQIAYRSSKYSHLFEMTEPSINVI